MLVLLYTALVMPALQASLYSLALLSQAKRNHKPNVLIKLKRAVEKYHSPVFDYLITISQSFAERNHFPITHSMQVFWLMGYHSHLQWRDRSGLCTCFLFIRSSADMEIIY